MPRSFSKLVATALCAEESWPRVCATQLRAYAELNGYPAIEISEVGRVPVSILIHLDNVGFDEYLRRKDD